MKYTEQCVQWVTSQLDWEEHWQHKAWDPCADDFDYTCDCCHTRLYDTDTVYVDKRNAFLGCEDCVVEDENGGIIDIESGEEIEEAGKWRSKQLLDAV